MTTRDGRSSTILIVVVKASLRAMLRAALEESGHVVVEAGDQPEAEAVLSRDAVDLVLTDLRLPAGDGLGVLAAVKTLDTGLPVVVMTAYGGLEDAVKAMRDGALDFIGKPINLDHLGLLVARGLADRQRQIEYGRMREALAAERGAPPLVGGHESLRRVLHALQRAATTDTTVLLEGESGTGKELFARRLHALSRRAEGPFVAINCAAIPHHLLESELFGHEKGAFTGAVSRRPGRFEIADGGTLFLDEIGDLPLELQPKLLRALESRQVDRLGGARPVPVDVRVVAATNKSLRAGVVARRFREDLYFRLSAFPIAIPALRERAADIALLATHFLDRFCREQGVALKTLTPEAVDALERYSWPGNVRELQNCIERATIIADAPAIGAHHLNLTFVPAPEAASVSEAEPAAGAPDPWAHIDLSGTLAEVTRRVVGEVERRKIASALAEAGGDPGAAAERLCMPYRAVLAKIREHRLAG
jgi:DNA-binding NtrC family response regulator